MNQRPRNRRAGPGPAPTVGSVSVAEPTRPPVRAAVLFAVAAMAAVAAALAVVFWAVLEPVRGSGCNTTLPAGAFRDALGPAHAAAAAALGALIWRLDARRSASGRARLATRIALAVIGAFTVACLIWPALFGSPALIALIASVPLGVALTFTIAVRTALIARQRLADPWPAHAVSVQVLLWAALCVGLPAHLTAAWASGASFFCF